MHALSLSLSVLFYALCLVHDAWHSCSHSPQHTLHLRVSTCLLRDRRAYSYNFQTLLSTEHTHAHTDTAAHIPADKTRFTKVTTTTAPHCIPKSAQPTSPPFHSVSTYLAVFAFFFFLLRLAALTRDLTTTSTSYSIVVRSSTHAYTQHISQSWTRNCGPPSWVVRIIV